MSHEPVFKDHGLPRLLWFGIPFIIVIWLMPVIVRNLLTAKPQNSQEQQASPVYWKLEE